MLVGGESQQQVLTQLLEHKAGMTVDELVDTVGLSRSAINQHLFGVSARWHIRK